MRILLLCNKSPWPPKDGGASATLNMIKGLSAAKVSVTVLAFNTLKHHVEKTEIPETLTDQTEIYLVDLNTEINYPGIILNLVLSSKPYNLQRFRSRKYSEKLSELLQGNYDIVQIEGLSLVQYLPLIRKYTSSPVVFRPHNIEGLIWHFLAQEEKNKIKKVYFRILSQRLLKLERSIINNVDAIVPVSPEDCDWFKSKGLTIPSILNVPGYIPDELPSYSDPSPVKVFFIGALDWIPNTYGLYWLINKVWPLVVDKRPSAELFIAGRNASVKTEARLKGKNVFYAGEAESSSDFINDKNIMVVPLFSGSGLRMKIIEGMSQGKPIVATSTAAKGLYYKQNEDILISDSESEFAGNIIELLDNSTLRRKLGENGIRNVRKNYNILASSEELVNFYRELLHAD